jgi:hypothetical protein
MDRPVVHCLLAWRLPDGDYIVRDRIATLEDAADFARFGWEVLVDYATMEALTRWEQLHRTPSQR